MAMTTMILLCMGSRVKPFFEAVKDWRQGLTEPVRPFIATALLADDGTVTTNRPGKKRNVLLNDLAGDMIPESWQHNLDSGLKHRKKIKAWIQSLFQEVRQESHIRTAASHGLNVLPGIRVVLVSTTFDPVGSSLELFFAKIIRQVALEGNLPLTVHLYQVAPDAFYEGVSGVPEPMILKREERESAAFRTVEHIEKIQEIFLNPNTDTIPPRRLFRDCWLVSNITERGTCLNNFTILTRTLVEFISILQHPDLRLPNPAGMLTEDGNAPVLNSLGTYELHMARTSMRQAFRSKVTLAGLAFLHRWQKRTFDHQEIDSKIRDLIHERRLDMVRERFSRDDNGQIIHVPFLYQETTIILENEEEVKRYATDLKSAWKEYRRLNEARLFEEIVRRQEQLSMEEGNNIINKCRAFMSSTGGELPAGIAYLSAWLNRESQFVRGSNISVLTGFREIRERVTEYWDDLMDVPPERHELKKIQQTIVDKTSLAEKLENQLATTRRIYLSEPDTEAVEFDDLVKSNDLGNNQQRLEQEIEELDVRLGATKKKLDKLIAREKKLHADLREIDQGVEDPGIRRSLFQERIEDRALEEYSSVIQQLSNSAASCKQAKEKERQAKQLAEKVLLQWLLIYNLSIFLAVILLASFFYPGLNTLYKVVAPVTMAAIFLNTLVGTLRYFLNARRAWLRSRKAMFKAETEQQTIQNKAVSILTKLEKNRSDFAACFYAIEWYHVIRENLSDQLLNLVDGLNELRRLYNDSVSSWKAITTVNSEHVREFPNNEHLAYLWKTEKEAIRNIIVSRNQDNSCFNDILDHGAVNALETFKMTMNDIADIRFKDLLSMDIVSLLEYLNTVIPGFSLEKILRECLDNTVPLVNVHEFTMNQGATETFLVGLKYREDAQTVGLFGLASRDKKIRLVPTEEHDRVIFIRLLMKFAPSHWIFFDALRQNIEEESYSDYQAIAH